MERPVPEKSILFVDDELTTSISELLEYSGFLVISCESGREALQEIESGLRYDLALVDLALPDIDGWDVIRASKRRNPRVPVLVRSAYDVIGHGPADGVLPKGRGIEELVAGINKYLPR